MTNIYVEKSSEFENGHRLIAGKSFKKGEVVMIWSPEVLNREQFEKLDPVTQKEFVYEKDEDCYLLMNSPERYINHSSEPNTRVHNLCCDVAIRDIKEGEELTTDKNA